MAGVARGVAASAPTSLRDKAKIRLELNIMVFYACTPKKHVVRSMLERHGPVRVTLPSDPHLHVCDFPPDVDMKELAPFFAIPRPVLQVDLPPTAAKVKLIDADF